MMNVPVWMCVLILAPICASYKILVVSPLPSKSHAILGDAYVNLLLEAGHEVTYITGMPKNVTHPLLHEVDVSDNAKYFPETTLNIKGILDKDVDVNDPGQFMPIVISMCKGTLEHKEVKNLLLDVDQNFDLVIAEWMFNEVYSGLSAVFNCPFVWFSTIEQNFMILRLIDEPSSPAYTSSTMSANIVPFTFMQRLEELFMQIVVVILRDWTMYYTDKETYNNVFGPATAKRGRQLPSYDETRYNASLVLGNSHVSMGEANSLPQSYKAIGGYHIDPKVKPLPKDLQTIMDNATKGVIYFSMGSNMNSRDMPNELKNNLIEMFSQLDQTVLWKFEEDFPNLPKNVHVLKWAPQHSILDHPNCVLFITHGGLLSTTEAVHFGVPIIGIPVFGDQPMNVQRAVNKGYAIKVGLSYDMTEDLRKAIQEMVNNPSYRSKVKDLSFIYHHRPSTPQAEFVHWVEHVIKTGGAPHLRSPAIIVPWYQKLYLDLMALLVALLFLITVALRKLISLYRTSKQPYKMKTN